MTDIFISYSRKDIHRVKPFAKALETHGWSVWWDRSIPPGKTFAQVIEAAITDAKCVVVMWSESSIASDWVKEEANIGKRRGVLIPTLLDPVGPPLGFGLIQAADLTDWDVRTPHAGFSFLLEAIKMIIGPPPERCTELVQEMPDVSNSTRINDNRRDPESTSSEDDNKSVSPGIPKSVDENNPAAVADDLQIREERFSLFAIIFTSVSAVFLIGMYFFYRFILNNISDKIIE
ncbi:MAG: toll/interleukin-1 receptor domain-containing protein [Desulfobacteraceae bacterium]|jgi:hypothetical protein|nr:toll/interleukin-1 receptor domain-containing protein [Desulfobacteraceae bacterium]